MDPTKVSSVLQWPAPQTVKGVRGFLGLTGYYRKFIRNYGKIARPLTDLTKKDGFKWGGKEQEAFEELKRRVTTAPVLALPDFTKEFVIESDASGNGLGAILLQERRPIAFFSKALSDRNLNKSAYEKELMAVALAIQHWRPYLLGRKFTVCTDQKSLKQLMQQRITTMDQQNWVAKLLGYRFDIVYKPGLENRGADALSRKFDGLTADVESKLEMRQDVLVLHNMISSPEWQDYNSVREEVQNDAMLQGIISDLQSGKNVKKGYTYQNGVLLYKGRLVMAANSVLIPTMLKEFHSTPQGGHSGFYRTYRRLAANVYWIGIKKQVQEFVQQCDVCQRNKYAATAPGGLLQPLPVPNQVWEEISMDFITGLPKSKGFETIFVVVDRLSKYSHFIPLKRPLSARSVADIFMKEVVRLHGMPVSVVSDRDPIFVSNFWQELFKLQGTQLKMSTAYHPQTDGQTEVVNRCLETFLRCFISDQPKTWVSWIPWAEYWYNTTFHVSTGTTPFEAVYGRLPPTITSYLPGEVKVEAVRRELVDRDECLRQLKRHLARARDRMKSQADKHRKERSFEIGEMVFLKLRPHVQQSVTSRICPKLSPRYYGPFKVLDRIGAVAYRLELPAASRIHPVFHVSLLKKVVGNVVVHQNLPESLEVTGESPWEAENVLAHRKINRNGAQVSQVLVQWRSKPTEEATWEDTSTMAAQFPCLSLEDKAAFQGEGNDRIRGKPVIWRVYERRVKKAKEK